MTALRINARGYRLSKLAVVFTALLFGACSSAVKKEGAAPPVAPAVPAVKTEDRSVDVPPVDVAPPVGRGPEIEDLSRIPQKFQELPVMAGDGVKINDACSSELLAELRERYFSRWTSSKPLFPDAETIAFMKSEARGSWYGTNKRRVSRNQLQELLHNCALESFPSRSDTAIAVAPCHLRGLPTHLPFYEKSEGAPFDMLSYPQIKLNEPLRVRHVSRNGAWLYVETGYSNGWVEKRDVALVDQPFIASWMQAPPLVIIRDYQPVTDGRGIATFPVKLGTILPLAQSGEDWWEVNVASAGEGGKAEVRTSRIPREAAAPLPLAFNKENVALIGNQMLGQPYGWGELYGLRDCSALLRDFFLPFGIWMPRTALDQIGSVPRHKLAALAPPKKEEFIKSRSLPFLTLLYKRGHIVLYAGEDPEGRPLVFQNSWSIRVKEGTGARTQIVGSTAITTLEPGKELGLVPGSSLLEKFTEMGTITDRCEVPESKGGDDDQEAPAAPSP